MIGETVVWQGFLGSITTSAAVALFTTMPTYAGDDFVEPTDTDYVRGDLNAVASQGAGSEAETWEVTNGLGELTFGSAGAATGYTVVGVGLVQDTPGGDCYKYTPYNKVVAVGEIPRIPVNELTVILR